MFTHFTTTRLIQNMQSIAEMKGRVQYTVYKSAGRIRQNPMLHMVVAFITGNCAKVEVMLIECLGAKENTREMVHTRLIPTYEQPVTLNKKICPRNRTGLHRSNGNPSRFRLAVQCLGQGGKMCAPASAPLKPHASNTGKRNQEEVHTRKLQPAPIAV